MSPSAQTITMTAALSCVLLAVAGCAPKSGEAERKEVAAPLATDTGKAVKTASIAPLRVDGERFVDPSGKIVNFWGMNLVAFYPDHALAERTAENLASLGINMVRPHHNLRPSADWNPPTCHSLLNYQGNSRDANPEAWERFDYLNAKLREKNIYLAFSIHWSRSYFPDDVSILKVSEQDDKEWADAMKELNSWKWQKSFDPRKMLPVFDERCFLLSAEFARSLMTHVNPHTGIAYGKEPQVATLELINEFSSEYTLICKNVFPDYWTKMLNAKLKEFAQARGVAPFELYKAATKEQRRCFAEFCAALDESYAKRMEKVVRECGYQGAVGFSNLWRGDNSLSLRSRTDGYIEDHAYEDPLVVKDFADFTNLTRSAVRGKPFVIGELNQSENQKLIAERKPVRSMLPMAIAATASLQNWSGVIWFAWCHGGRAVGTDGWGKKLEAREPSIGDLVEDSVILDHIRSAGIIYKNGYLSGSVEPITLFVDDPAFAGDYNGLMNGQYQYKPGWQFVHAVRKAFGPVPQTQKDAPWMKESPGNPVVSDTKQIVTDTQRRQMSFSAPKAEGFSGYLDGKPIGNLHALGVSGEAGFATVIAVTRDDAPLAQAKQILVSKTCTDADGKESASTHVSLKGLAKGAWRMTVTRPARMAAEPQLVEVGSDGSLKLPASSWNECELEIR